MLVAWVIFVTVKSCKDIMLDVVKKLILELNILFLQFVTVLYSVWLITSADRVCNRFSGL